MLFALVLAACTCDLFGDCLPNGPECDAIYAATQNAAATRTARFVATRTPTSTAQPSSTSTPTSTHTPTVTLTPTFTNTAVLVILPTATPTCRPDSSGCGPKNNANPGSGDSGSGGPVDADGDGYVDGVDCDDGDASVHPGAGETIGDGVDSDCDGEPDL
jgi:hypothetical protein